MEELKTNTDQDDASETEGLIQESSNYQLSETQRLDAQKALKKFGFYNGMIDGDIGPATKLAVKSWQEATGYSATGELTVDQIGQLLLDEEVLPDILKPESGQSITAVMVQITKPTFDVYSCAFQLEFTNSASGRLFDVVLYAEGSDGKFKASTKDIQKALANSGLTEEDNNWKALSIKAKKYDDPNVVCQPANQNSYSITEDGAEGVFNIDSVGKLSMTDLPIVAVSENGVAEEATNTEPIFSQSITSVIAEISNPDFDVANCTFNLEFTDGLSGKSFLVKMDPEGEASGKFTAGMNSIEDGLADAGLTAEDNQWALLTVKVKKFDYPFVSCQPANQNFYFISKDEAEGTFSVDSDGALTMTGLPIVEIREGGAADELEKLRSELALSNRQLTDLRTQFENQQALLDDPQAALSKEKAISAKARRKMALLDQQAAALRAQLQNLQGLLNDELAKNIAEEVQLQNLGSQLNSALARVAAEERKRRRLEEAERKRLEREALELQGRTEKLSYQAKDLEKYRSEFFDRLRDVLGQQEGVRIAGDRLVFSSEVLFPPGGADLSPEGQQEVAKVAEILKTVAGLIPGEINWVIRFDGHTDDTKVVSGSRFADNWHLSQARALSVVRYFANTLDIPPNRLAANGFGEYQPVNTENTPEARAQNRRIELKLTEK
ncbi:peptidoglycan -binding protein [Paracoccaceae bacterium]|nr:peptidoglycan -binding protein [Paracoccaceae bacterium]